MGQKEASKLLFSVDTAGRACRQSKIRDCRDTVDDRLSTTALLNTKENICEWTRENRKKPEEKSIIDYAIVSQKNRNKNQRH